jgi:hypothetical protein
LAFGALGFAGVRAENPVRSLSGSSVIAFLTPLRGLFISRLHPRLAPWAAFLRRFAARTTWWGLLFWLVGAMRPWWRRSGLCGSCFWGGVFFWWCSDFAPSYLVVNWRLGTPARIRVRRSCREPSRFTWAVYPDDPKSDAGFRPTPQQLIERLFPAPVKLRKGFVARLGAGSRDADAASYISTNSYPQAGGVTTRGLLVLRFLFQQPR